MLSKSRSTCMTLGEFVGKVSGELMILGAVSTALAAVVVDILR